MARTCPSCGTTGNQIIVKCRNCTTVFCAKCAKGWSNNCPTCGKEPSSSDKL